MEGIWITLGTDEAYGGKERCIWNPQRSVWWGRRWVKDEVEEVRLLISAVSKDGTPGNSEGTVNILESDWGKGTLCSLTEM
jgi:hypothetical protein